MTDVASRLDEIEARVMAGLKDFQRATVERVAWLFEHRQDRVLVSDEVGLGKTLVARGMVDRIRKALLEVQEDGNALLDEVKDLCRAIRRNGDQRVGGSAVIGKLRVVFAQISLDKLEPDLVILDKFQRFRFLLTADPDSEVGMLAHRFFHTEGLRMLLLSATPYKMYSTLEEIEGEQVDIYYKEFLDVMKFLNWRKPVRPSGSRRTM